MNTLDLIATYWPHASAALAGMGARHIAPRTWLRARTAFVDMCRAVVAHEDGNDAEALTDVKLAIADTYKTVGVTTGRTVFQEAREEALKAGIPSEPAPPLAPPPGTVTSWPK